jgi:hypothetical protein
MLEGEKRSMCVHNLVLPLNVCPKLKTCELVKGATCWYGPHNYCGRYREMEKTNKSMEET